MVGVILLLLLLLVLDWRWVVMAALFLYVLSPSLTYETMHLMPFSSPHYPPPPFLIPSFTGSESTPAANNDPLPAECPPVGTGTPGVEGYEEKSYTTNNILSIYYILI